MATETSRRRSLLVGLACALAAATFGYRIVRGDGSVTATLAVVAFSVVVALTVWELSQSWE